MTLGFKIKSTVVICCLAAIALLALNYYTDNRVSYTAIETIENAQLHPNDFADLGKQIAVESAQDLGYSVSDTNITIFYGAQVIKVPKKSLEDVELVKRLNAIGLRIYEKDGVYKITYWDEELPQWTNVN